MKRNSLWYLYIFICFSHILLLVSTVLKDDFVISDMTNRFSRIVLFTVIFLIFFFIFLKKELFKKKNYVLILLLLSFTVYIDSVGNYFNLYKGTNFDDWVHFLNPLVISICIFIYFFRIKSLKRNISILLGSSISLSLIAIWEIYEYWSDILLDTHLVIGLEDTSTDLTYGLFGVVVSLIFILLFKSSGSRSK